MESLDLISAVKSNNSSIVAQILLEKTASIEEICECLKIASIANSIEMLDILALGISPNQFDNASLVTFIKDTSKDSKGLLSKVFEFFSAYFESLSAYEAFSPDENTVIPSPTIHDYSTSQAQAKFTEVARGLLERLPTQDQNKSPLHKIIKPTLKRVEKSTRTKITINDLFLHLWKSEFNQNEQAKYSLKLLLKYFPNQTYTFEPESSLVSDLKNYQLKFNKKLAPLFEKHDYEMLRLLFPKVFDTIEDRHSFFSKPQSGFTHLNLAHKLDILITAVANNDSQWVWELTPEWKRARKNVKETFESIDINHGTLPFILNSLSKISNNDQITADLHDSFIQINRLPSGNPSKEAFFNRVVETMLRHCTNEKTFFALSLLQDLKKDDKTLDTLWEIYQKAPVFNTNNLTKEKFTNQILTLQALQNLHLTGEISLTFEKAYQSVKEVLIPIKEEVALIDYLERSPAEVKKSWDTFSKLLYTHKNALLHTEDTSRDHCYPFQFPKDISLHILNLATDPHSPVKMTEQLLNSFVDHTAQKTSEHSKTPTATWIKERQVSKIKQLIADKEQNSAQGTSVQRS